jgi:(p)ppGpp synthase/HD superfamily hydrolase
MSNDPEKEAMRIFGIAYAIAEKAHAGQYRRLPDGRPYIEHVKDVAAMMPTWELKTVAILHDSIEDSDGMVTAQMLLNAGIPGQIVDAVVAMTKPKGAKSYLAYVRNHVKPNELATKVKLADNYVNMRDRLISVIAGGPKSDSDYKKLSNYAKSIALLIEPETIYGQPDPEVE